MLASSLMPAMSDGFEDMPNSYRLDAGGSDNGMPNGGMPDAGSDNGRPDFARRVIQARERAGMTQRQLADKLRRSQQTIAGWEAGKREPDVATYKEIAEATRVDLVWLILGRDPDYGGTISALLAKAQEQSRYFAWAFKQASDFLAEEGVDADFSYVFAYAQKLLRIVDRNADEAGAKEAMLRAIELDRNELRMELDKARKRIL